MVSKNNKKAKAQTDYTIDEILEEKVEDGVKYYLVGWKGYGPKDNSWEPEENLANVKGMIKKFEKKKNNKKPSISNHLKKNKNEEAGIKGNIAYDLEISQHSVDLGTKKSNQLKDIVHSVEEKESDVADQRKKSKRFKAKLRKIGKASVDKDSEKEHSRTIILEESIKESVKSKKQNKGSVKSKRQGKPNEKGKRGKPKRKMKVVSICESEKKPIQEEIESVVKVQEIQTDSVTNQREDLLISVTAAAGIKSTKVIGNEVFYQLKWSNKLIDKKFSDLMFRHSEMERHRPILLTGYLKKLILERD